MLVFDGLDRCSITLKHRLEAKFKRLQGVGLFVMVTSRYPLEPFIDESGKLWRLTCDVHDHKDGVIETSVHWTCRKCKEAGRSFSCCNSWKEKPGKCEEW